MAISKVRDYLLCCATAAVSWNLSGCVNLSMPGQSYRGQLPALTETENSLAERLRSDVSILADRIGERNLVNYTQLNETADYLMKELTKCGYSVEEQHYRVPLGGLSKRWSKTGYPNQIYRNISAELKGSRKPDEIIVVGAHYDSVPIAGCKAANDNGSGVAATLAMARRFAGKPQRRTIRFVFFSNEEPPFFWTKYMGSYVYARQCRRKEENIVAMWSLETVGCYSDEKGSQGYPWPLSWYYPSEGNFVAFVGNTGSRELVKRSTALFRKNARFPSEGAALPMLVPRIGSSDHWSFWKAGYPALMVTDTAPYRYPYYHTAHDDSDQLDYQRMARVINGLTLVLSEIANEGPDD